MLQADDDYEYRFTVIFPKATAYSIDDIVSFISVVEQRLDASEWNDDARNEFKAELIERLLKSVVDGQFELRNLSLNKVIAPPINKSSISTKVLPDSSKPSPVKAFWIFLRNTFSDPSFIKALKHSTSAPRNSRSRQDYKSDFWWARMTFIYRSDLVKFCKGQRILATFEDESVKTSELTGSNQDAITKQKFCESSKEDVAQPVDNQDAIASSKCASAELKCIVQSEDKSEIADDNALQNVRISDNKKASRDQRKFGPEERQVLLKGFDGLPDSSYVNIDVVAAFFDIAPSTVERRTRSGILKKHHLGERDTRWLVGEVRTAKRNIK